jgi:hypothetical protein
VRYAAAALAALLAAAPAHARPPEVVPWSDAAAHVGSIVTVEGTVARARVENGACTMEFAPDDPAAFRVVLMLALFQSPTDPERLYSGRRVRASGRVQTYQGRPEMIIRRADQIEILDAPPTTTTLAPPPPPAVAPTPSTSTSTVPTPTVPPTTMPRPAPTAAPAPATGSTPVPTTAPAPAPSPVAPVRTQRCAQARERLEAARRELSTRSEDAARCLREGSSRCEREREAVARALEALPARETEADSACE